MQCVLQTLLPSLCIAPTQRWFPVLRGPCLFPHGGCGSQPPLLCDFCGEQVDSLMAASAIPFSTLLFLLPLPLELDLLHFAFNEVFIAKFP